MVFLTEKLEVYQKALDFTAGISQICRGFPKGNYWLSDQLKSASLSIPLNIAEGNGRWHKKERRNHFLIARGSVFECLPILEICKRNGLIDKIQLARLRKDLETLSKMLTGLIKGLEQRNNRPTDRN